MKKLFRIQIVLAVLFLNGAIAQVNKNLHSAKNALHANLNQPKNTNGLKEIWTTKNPFERRVFIENKGQFDSENNIPANKIKYGVCEGGVYTYFSSKGLLYRHDAYPVLTEEQKEKLEDLKGKRQERLFEKLKVKTTIVNMELLGSNPDAQIISEDKVFDYFCYGSIKANGFKKIIYKNIYPKIDIEYTMRAEEDGWGMKYVIVLHPGADASMVKMKYTNADKIKLTEAGDIVLKSAMGNITDHAPKTFYQNGNIIASNFVLTENIVTFNLANYDKSKTVIIDPTVVFPGTPPGKNAFGVATPEGPKGKRAYDVVYDYAGNVYVLGGIVPYSIVKLNSAGTILWSYHLQKHFGAALFQIGAGTAYGDFTVDPQSQSVYFCEGFAIGVNPCRIGKIGPKGDSIATNTSATGFNEMWRMEFNACVGKAVIAGASNAQAQGGPFHMAIVDTSMASVAAVNVLNDDRDMAILAMDDFGDAFGACSQLGGVPNTMARMPLASNFAPTWTVPSQHDHIEFTANSYVVGNTGGYNGMAVTNKFLYTFDGTQLRKWNKTGTLLNTISVKAGAPDFKTGGIAADNDDNVYVGVDKSVKTYDANLALVSTTAAPDSVFDIKLSKNNQLYVCGSGFVTTFAAVPSSSNFTFSITPTNSCGGGAGSAEAIVTAGVPPYSYKWSTSPVQTTAIATNLVVGTYTCTVIDASCAKAVATQTVAITSGAAVPVAVNSATICEGNSVTLNASGATSYSWNPSTGLSTTNAATTSASPTVTTTYTVTGTSGACSGTATATVTVNATPVVSVNSQNICNGTNATLTASGATSYTWTPATNLSATNIAGVTANPSSAINYTVTGTTNGCSASATASVTVNPPPVSNAGNDITICSGKTGQLGAAPSPGGYYGWNSTTGLNDATLANPTITLTNTGATPLVSTYTITTSPGGCSSTDEVKVTVLPNENAAFSYPSNLYCVGGSDPSVTISGTTGGVFSSAPAGLSLNASTGLVTLASSTIGTYTVTYTTQGVCPDTADFILSIVGTPKADFTHGGPYCRGDVPNAIAVLQSGASYGTFTASPAGIVFSNAATGEVDLTASAANTYTITNTIAGGGASGCPPVDANNSIVIIPTPNVTLTSQSVCQGAISTLTASGADSYSWSNSVGESGNTLSIKPSTTSTYTVIGTSLGCSSFAIGTVTTIATPTLTITSKKDTICEGDTLALNVIGAISYSWSNSAVGSTTNVNPSSTTIYTVTGNSSICSATATKQVVVRALPTITVNSLAICKGLSGVLTPSGGNSYIWSDTTFVTPKTISPATTTTYTVFGSTANCTTPAPNAPMSALGPFFNCWSAGCLNAAAATVTVVGQPTLTVNSPAICAGATATLTANGGSSYTWSDGTTGNIKTVQPTTTTSYTVSDNTAGCSDTEVSTVTVTNPPVVTVNSETICSGESTTLTASGASSYAWLSSGGVTSTSNPYPITPVSTTSYTVTGNPGGCPGYAFTSVTVNAIPNVTATGDTICEGLPATISSAGAVNYAWSSGDNTQVVTVTPKKTTSYIVTGTDSKGCKQTANATVTVFPQPDAAFDFTPERVGILEPEVSISDKSSIDVTYWKWSFGDGDTLVTTEKSFKHKFPPVENTYVISLDVLNAGGCPNSVSHDLIVGPEFTIYVPNAFSPNDDDKNETFGASGGGIVTFEMLIFDRWGNLVFTADDITKTWDGKLKGAGDIVTQDTYVWKIKVTDVFKKNHEFVGTVSILK